MRLYVNRALSQPTDGNSVSKTRSRARTYAPPAATLSFSLFLSLSLSVSLARSFFLSRSVFRGESHLEGECVTFASVWEPETGEYLLRRGCSRRTIPLFIAIHLGRP
jgi:hypothetical protein